MMKNYLQNGLIHDLSHIRRVDIELHSFCNRVCEWCPNKTYLRNKQTKMEDWVFDKILNELNDFNFAPERNFYTPDDTRTVRPPFVLHTENQPVISFLGFMEPMADIQLLKKRVQQTKNTLPAHVEIFSSTNGDYISRKNLENLYLTSLFIMDYDHKGSDYWKDELTKAGCLVIEDNDLGYDGVIATHKHIGLVRVKINWKDLVYIEDRAGVLSQNEPVIKELKWKNSKEYRVVPCPEPSYFINITFDGSVMPCCHIRSDIPMHKDYILGNIKDNTLLEILNSPRAVDFRQRLTVENGDYPSPCKTCQKIRPINCSGAPNGFNWNGEKYSKNKLAEINDF